MKYLKDDTIPKPLYDALVGSDEEYGDEVKEYLSKHRKDINISCTSLQTPTQALILQQRHSSEIWVDPLKDCWHSMNGGVVHWILEKYAAKDPRYYTEFRLGTDITVDGRSCHVHAKMDLYDREECKIQDWKLTNAKNMLYGGKEAYERQLNVIRYIMVRNKYKVKALEDIYLFPHLDKTMMNRPGYPQRNALTVPVKMDDIIDTEEYITKRVSNYIQEKDKSDKNLSPCTDEERWIRGSLFKVHLRKKGTKKEPIAEFNSRAAFKSESNEDVNKFITEEGVSVDNVRVVEVKGEPRKCDYCKAAPFCHQFQKYQKEKAQLTE